MDTIGKEGHSCLRQQKEEDIGQSGDERWKRESCMLLVNVLGHTAQDRRCKSHSHCESVINSHILTTSSEC